MEVIKEADRMTHISYVKLFRLLQSRNILQSDFIKGAKVSGATLQNMRHNGHVNTKTICNICDYLHVHPNDIMDWIYVDPEEARLQAKIEDLQKQLQELKKANKGGNKP